MSKLILGQNRIYLIGIFLILRLQNGRLQTVVISYPPVKFTNFDYLWITVWKKCCPMWKRGLRAQQLVTFCVDKPEFTY